MKSIEKFFGFAVPILILLLALLLLGPRLASHFFANSGFVHLSKALTSSSNIHIQQQVVKAESLFNSAVLIFGSNHEAHRGLGVSYTLQGRSQDALLAWKKGTEEELRMIWDRNHLYRQGTATEPGLNTDLTNSSAGDHLVLDSFASAVNWLPCTWSTNAEGSISAEDGELEVSFQNSTSERDRFCIFTMPKDLRIDNYSNLLLRVKGSKSSNLTIELVVDSERIRPLNYEPLEEEWQVRTIPLQGASLSEISLTASEIQPELNPLHNLVQIDWIILK